MANSCHDMLFAVVQTAAVSCSQFCQNDERVLSFPSKALHADRILKSFLISSLPLVIRKDSCQGCAYVCEGIRGHFAMCLLTSPSGTNSHSTNPDWPLFRGRFSQRARSARPRLLLRATPFPGLWPSGRQNWFQPFGLAGGFLGAPGAKRDGKVEKLQRPRRASYFSAGAETCFCWPNLDPDALATSSVNARYTCCISYALFWSVFPLVGYVEDVACPRVRLL